MQRSGWGERGAAFADERWLLLDAGPLGDGGHGHYDALHLEAYAYGRPLVVDPGRYTYSESGPNWRHWFKGTAAHNTVTVDGLDQTPYRRGKPKPDRAARARVLWRHRTDDDGPDDSGPDLDVVRAQVHSSCYDAVHTRDVVFVAGEYWLVADHLLAATTHDYSHRLHLTARAWGRTTVARRALDVVVRAPDVDLVYAAGDVPLIEEGWVAPRYGVKERAPVVAVERRQESDTAFVVVLWPRRPTVAPKASAGRASASEPDGDGVRGRSPRGGTVPPRLRVDHAAPELVSVRVEGVGRHGRSTDHVAWAVEPRPLRLGPLSVTARVAWLRVDGDGEPERLAVYDGGRAGLGRDRAGA